MVIYHQASLLFAKIIIVQLPMADECLEAIHFVDQHGPHLNLSPFTLISMMYIYTMIYIFISPQPRGRYTICPRGLKPEEDIFS